MKLQLIDRFNISQLLPESTNFMEYALKRSIAKKVGITAEEQEKFNIRQDEKTNTIKWDAQKDAENPLEVDFSQDELKFLQKACEATVDAPHTDQFWHTVEKIYDQIK